MSTSARLFRQWATSPRSHQITSRFPSGRIVTTSRSLHQSPRSSARKDAMGKDDLKPESNEYSKTGSDQESAALDDAAFNPQKTRPEEEHDAAGRESNGHTKTEQDSKNPLNVSPANQDVSHVDHSNKAEGSPATSGKGEQERARASGGGSAPKNGGGQYGGGGV